VTEVSADLRDSGLTARLADYSAATEFATLPPDIVDRAKRVILDELGCMILGSTMPAGERMRSFVLSQSAAGEATIAGARSRTSATLASLVNGTAAHADQLDGVHVTQSHPSGAAVAAGLALGETESLGGQELINAVVLAFDLSCRLVETFGGGHEIRRVHHFHGGPLSAIGIACASGRLLGLEPVQLRHAMALATLSVFIPASFYEERNQMSKAMNQGQAAYAGVTGALLAKHGFEGHDGILEARDGVIDIWRTDRTDVAILTAGLGAKYSIMDSGFKYYPVGYPMQSAIAGALQIARDEGLRPDDIAEISVGLAPGSANMVDGKAVVQLSLQNMIALGLTLGRLSYDDVHDPSSLSRPDVRRLSDAVKVVRDETMTKDAEERRATWVSITATDGRTRRGPVRIAPGHWELGGMPWGDLREKFTGLVEPRLGHQATEEIIELVRNLEDADHLTDLTQLLICHGRSEKKSNKSNAERT
jgi:2-methylcitrate dehydratase PrpD